jgi:transcriptional regulator with XRE-family HTH domain
MTTAAARDQYFSDFAAALRYWRGKRGYSQLRLSTESEISQRHISFLESGRSQPSKELILKLGMVLEIPLRQRNVRYARRSISCCRSRRPIRRWWSTVCGSWSCSTNRRPA